MNKYDSSFYMNWFPQNVWKKFSQNYHKWKFRCDFIKGFVPICDQYQIWLHKFKSRKLKPIRNMICCLFERWLYQWFCMQWKKNRSNFVNLLLILTTLTHGHGLIISCLGILFFFKGFFNSFKKNKIHLLTVLNIPRTC